MDSLERVCIVVFADSNRLREVMERNRCVQLDAVHDAIIATGLADIDHRDDDVVFRRFVREFRHSNRTLKWQDRRHGIVTGAGRLRQGALGGFAYIDSDTEYEEPSVTDGHFVNVAYDAAVEVVSAMDTVRHGAVDASITTVEEDGRFTTAGMARRMRVSQSTAWRIINEYKDVVEEDGRLVGLLKLAIEDYNVGSRC